MNESKHTLRDYFAAHAPAEIPDWFQHKEPPLDFPPLPDWQTVIGEHQKLVRDWLSDGCYDLPEEVAWFAKAVEAHREGKAAWKRENAAERFFQWRWHYADLMIASRLTTKR